MIDISQLQSGDVLFTRVRWNWKYLPSYLSRAINFMVNFWAGIKTFFNKYNKKIEAVPYCPANHVMNYVNDNGKYLIYESNAKGYVPVDAYERLKDISADNIWVKRYNLYGNGVIFPSPVTAAKSIEGTGYGWIIILEQLIRQLSNETISFVWKKWKGLVCSQSVAKFINIINPNFCKDYLNMDPQDVFFDTDSEFVQVNFIPKNI